MIVNLKVTSEEEQCSTKTLLDKTIKLICNAPETYRIMIKYMCERNIVTTHINSDLNEHSE